MYTELHTQKTVKMVNFMLCMFYHNTFLKTLIWRFNELTHVKHHHSSQNLVDGSKNINVLSLFYPQVLLILQLETSYWIMDCI